MKKRILDIVTAGVMLAGCASPTVEPTATPPVQQVAVQPTQTLPPTSTPAPSATPTVSPANEGCVRATTEIPEGQNPTRFITSGPASGCYDSVGEFLDDIGLTWGEFAPGTAITFWTQWPVDPGGALIPPTPTTVPLSVTISPSMEDGFEYVCGHPPFTVDFSAQVSAGTGDLQYAWDFNLDGAIDATVQDPDPFTYQTPGVYNASITVRDAAGQTTVSERRVVVIGDPRYPDWRYGVHLDYRGGNIADDAASIAVISRYADLFSDIGVQGVRLDFAWTSLEPSDDNFSFRIHDQAVTILRDHGMDVMGIMAWTPWWASSSSTDPWKHMPRDIDDFSDYVYQLASHYTGRVNSWLIWNEPNVSIYFDTIDPTEYVKLLKAGYLAAKYGNPESTVVLAGLANDESQYQPQFRWYPPEQFLQAVYDLGGRDYFDAVGRHPYAHPLYGGYDEMVSKVSAIKDVMARNGDQNKPLYLDEVGYGLIWDVNEQVQAQWLYEIFRAARQTGVPLLIVFDCQDWPDGSEFEKTIGLLRLDGSPRPLFDAYADIIRQGS